MVDLGYGIAAKDLRFNERHPNKSLMVVDGRYGIMLPSLEAECDSAAIVQKFQQRAVQLFFDPEEDGYRKLLNKMPIAHCVAHRSERLALGGC